MHKFETEIANMLHKDNDPISLKNHVIKEVKYDDTLDLSELKKRAEILLNSGQVKSAFICLKKMIDNHSMVPSTLILKFINQSSIKTNKKQLRLLEDTCEHNKYETIALLGSIPHKSKATPYQLDCLETLKKNEFTHRKRLIEKIEFMKNQQIIDEEKTAIDQYLKSYPTDQFYKNELKSFELRWANKVLKDKLPKQRDSFEIKSRSELPDFLVKEFKDLSEKKPSLCADLILFHIFCEEYTQAVPLIKYLPESESNFWLSFELAVRAENYFLALDLLTKIEYSFTDNPDTKLAVLYSKAIVLHGIGHRAKAVSLLKVIMSVKPDYRTTSTLLNYWKDLLHV